MKKMVFALIAFVALIGFLDCVLIEPALEYSKCPSMSQTDETHGCMMCQSVYHQWTAPEASAFVSRTPSLGMRVPLSSDLYEDIFPASIFHPPHSL